MTAPLPPVLDPTQLIRIEATHRGFLYQHVYTVGCLFLAQQAGVGEVRVERDEDIELALTDGAVLYLQIKTRLDGVLQPSDVASALERFALLRAAHSAAEDRVQEEPVGDTPGPDGHAGPLAPAVGRRTGDAWFVIVSSAPLSSSLQADLTAASWPDDVFVLWPGMPAQAAAAACVIPERLRPALPPAWPNLGDAIQWCATAASTIPFTRVVPTTLTWKLAAIVQAAAAGDAAARTAPHVFYTDALPELFEQVVRALHHVPTPPERYWPHDAEPVLLLDGIRHRVIVGPSGAGKSAWAATHAPHAPVPVVYVSVNGPSAPQFTLELARELAATCFAEDAAVIAQALAPGSTGFDALRVLALELTARGIRPLLLVDDAQRLEPDAALRAIESAPGLHWILLAHPGPVVGHLSARLAVTPEVLPGWSVNTIAAALQSSGAPTDLPTCHRVRALTSGLPLFVRNLAHLAITEHSGDVGALCYSLEAGSHLQRTAQEQLLQSTLNALTGHARAMVAILGVARVVLTLKEARGAAAAGGVSPGAAARAFRELVEWGVVQQPRQDSVQLHEAFRLPVAELSDALDGARTRAVQEYLCDAFDPSDIFSVDRAVRLIELLPLAGRLDRYTEIVGNQSEELAELGLAPYLTDVLARIAADTTMPPRARFWSLDTLAFWALQDGYREPARPLIALMAELHDASSLEPRAALALGTKRLQLAGLDGDPREARRAYDLLRAASGTDVERRVADYNYAHTLFRCGRYASAAKLADRLVGAYFKLLGLTQADVFRVNAQELARKLPPNSQDEAKRLADCLDLFAQAQVARGEPYGLARIWATKFYTLAWAPHSAIRLGMDVLNDLLLMDGGPEARRHIEQHLLPTIDMFQLHEHVISVRAAYAVVLAFCGEVDRAREEIERLLPFAAAAEHGHVHAQAALIEEIAAGRVEPPRGRPEFAGRLKKPRRLRRKQ